MAQRGRPSNEERARRAQEAAQIASQAAKSFEAQETELPVETQTPPEPQSQETEKDDLVRLAPRNEVRRQAMEEIEARDLQSKSETGLRGQLGLTDEPKSTEEQAPEPTPPTAEDMLKGSKFSQPESPQTVRVKIDGEEFDAPKEDVEAYGGVKAYQIAKAAENRLTEAKNTLAEAKKLQEKNTPTPQKDSEWMKERVEKLRWGTPDESAQALNEILERNNKPVDRNELVQAATDQMRHDAAVAQFDKEFTDIGASILHLKLVAALRNERLQKGHPGDWNQFYRSIGNEVRAVMPKQNQPNMTPKSSDSTSQSSDKEERKSSIVTLPQASQRASVSEEPKVESREEMLNNMRKKRGFQPHT